MTGGNTMSSQMLAHPFVNSSYVAPIVEKTFTILIASIALLRRLPPNHLLQKLMALPAPPESKGLSHERSHL